MKFKQFIENMWRATKWFMLGHVAVAITTIIGIQALILSHEHPWVYRSIVLSIYILLCYIAYKLNMKKEMENENE